MLWKGKLTVWSRAIKGFPEDWRAGKWSNVRRTRSSPCYLIWLVGDVGICDSSLQISENCALPKRIHLLFVLESRTGIHSYETPRSFFFLSALRKNFPKELPSMEWQFYRQSSSTIEIIPGVGSELEYFI